MGDLRKTLRALAFVALAAILAAAPARAEDCGHGAEGFGARLASFKEVAVMDGLSRNAVNAALDGVTYDPG
jgi:membrane-bound lytic murein transglycosylase B